jgi:hypothetical protein
MVLFSAQARSTVLQPRLDATWTRSGPFWIDLAETHRCPCDAWRFVPAELASDEALIGAWARYARPDEGSVDWLADAAAAAEDAAAEDAVAAATTSPQNLGLLSDPQVLLNWLPVLCSGTERGAELLRQIPSKCLAKDLWLELLANVSDDPRDYLSHMPHRLRQNPDVVRAQLQRCTKCEDLFRAVYSELSLDLQLHFAPLLAEAIQSSSASLLDESWVPRLPPELVRIPEVARAAIVRGWRPGVVVFSDEVVAWSSWSRDRAFLLSAARGESLPRVWTQLPREVRLDKAFVLKLLQVNGQLRDVLDDDLLNDFDVRCALFVMHPHRFEPTGRDLELAREARERLGRYVGLETFMRGVVARSRPPRIQGNDGSARDDRSSTSTWASPTALLNQDGYTLHGLRERLREYVGAPTDDHVAILRQVPNGFTKYGY